MSNPVKRFYEFGPFRIDPVKRLLLRDGETVPLTPKAFDTLFALLRKSGRVIEKDELMKEIWADTIVEEGGLTRNISVLRKTLGESLDDHQYIVTVPGRGYRFVASVNEVQDGGADLIVEERSTSRFVVEQEQDPGVSRKYATESHQVIQEKARASQGEKRASRSRLSMAALAACMLVVLAVALLYFWIWKKPNPTGPLAVRSMAVLPFKPLLAERRDAAVELGMAEALITKLSSIRQVTVRPISSVRKYTRIDQDPIAAGRELQVDAVLDASLQWGGDGRIRVTAQLLRVSDGSAIWTDKFDGQFATIFVAQDTIAERVAAVLTPHLTGKVKTQLAKHYTDSAEAYEFYLKARLFSQRASAEGYKKGLQFFEQAIEKDPAYALAWAGLADSYIRLGTRGLLPPEESWQKNAESAARRAVEIDDTLDEAHVALGSAILNDWHFSAAEAEFKRAIELDSSSEEACRRYSHFLWVVGRFDDAIAYAKQAREINPVSVPANSALARALSEAGQYDKAIEQYKKALDLDPNYVPALAGLAGAYAEKGMYEEAIVETKRAIEVDSSPQRRGQFFALGQFYARSGKKEEAEKVLAELKEHAKKEYIPPYNFGLLYEALGDKDLALASLEKAYGERDIALIELRKRGFDSLRSDQRFVDLLRRIEAASR